VEVIEYQDARGFLLGAQQLLQATTAVDPATAARLRRMAQGRSRREPSQCRQPNQWP
jgi:hypothetical protein